MEEHHSSTPWLEQWYVAIAIDYITILILLLFLYVYYTGAIAFSQASFGEGTGRIWLTNVRCLRSERALINCTASSNGVNSCMHSQDAGVRCPPGSYIYYMLHRAQ